MKYPPAILCALGILAAQYFYGGLLRQVFAFPGFLLVGIAGMFGLTVLFSKDRPKPETLAVFITVTLASWLLWRTSETAPNMETAAVFRLVLACLVTYLLFASVVTSSKSRLVFLILLFLAAMIQAPLGGYQFLRKIPDMPFPWASEALKEWYGSRLGGRGHGFFINGNHLAWFLNIAGLSALSVACWTRWRAWAKILALYVAAVCFAGCLPTLSRGGFVGLASGLSAFLIISGVALAFGAQGTRLPAFLTIGAGALVACGSAYMVFAESFTIQARLSLLTEDRYRTEIFQTTRRLFELDPVFGAGAASFKDAARAFRINAFQADDVYAHNDWMQMAAEFGFPAIALLLLLVGVHYVFGFQNLIRCLERRKVLGPGSTSNGAAIQIAALSSITACVAHSGFDFNMQIPANAMLAAAMAGMLANAGNPGRERGIPPVVFGFSLLCVGISIFLLANVISTGPAEKRHLDAENALYAGRYDEAIELSGSELQSGASTPDFFLIRARAYLKRGPDQVSRTMQIQDALAARFDFEAAARIRPLDAHNQIGLATALGRLGKFQESSDAAARAIEIFPLFYGGYQVLGLSLEGQQRPAEAIGVYATATTLPNSKESLLRMRALQKKIAP